MSRPARPRIPSFAVALLVAASLGAAVSGCGAGEDARPELVLITADRIDLDGLGCFGGSAEAGSSLCRLGEGGTRFVWAFAPGPDAASGAASTLTGLPPDFHGVSERGPTFLRDGATTVAESLRAAGYATGAFVGHRRLGSLRRLDQGFDVYLEGLADEALLAEAIERWTTTSEPPRFLWIQLPEDRSTAEVDRVLARLGGVLDSGREQAGVLVAALRGAPAEPGTIGVESHRVPIQWRPPASRVSTPAPPVSPALASLLDIAPTLRAAAGLEEKETGGGRPLEDLIRANAQLEHRPGSEASTRMRDASSERFLLLRSAGDVAQPEVGLASGPVLYVRRLDPEDDSGRPIPTGELISRGARYLERLEGPVDEGGVRLSPWREDVLKSESPVPRLEFHLARQLREARVAERLALPRPWLERD